MSGIEEAVMLYEGLEMCAGYYAAYYKPGKAAMEQVYGEDQVKPGNIKVTNESGNEASVPVACNLVAFTFTG